VEAGKLKGRPLPRWYLDCPALLKGDRLYLEAFWDLDPERQVSGGTMGRIPWTSARLYAIEELGLRPGMVRPFWRVVTAIDSAFLGWMRKEHDRHVKVNTPKPAKRTGKAKRVVRRGG
jgi:hypothetical protein